MKKAVRIDTRPLSLNMLDICSSYQRDLDMNWVKHIILNYNPDLVQPIQVSHRNGRYYVFDGQHTKKALEMMFGDSYPVLCKIYHGMSEEEEAEKFYAFNTSKKRMSSLAIIKAQTAYGDEEVQNFLQATRDAGFIIDPTKPSKCRYGIAAVKKAQRCFSILGPDVYKLMLSTLRRTWNGEHWSVSHNILGGMTILIRVFKGDIKVGQFVKRLSAFTDDDINREASHFYNLRTQYRYAWALGILYNKRGSRGALDLKKLNFVNF